MPLDLLGCRRLEQLLVGMENWLRLEQQHLLRIGRRRERCTGVERLKGHSLFGIFLVSAISRHQLL
ncbi:hypothetical protein EV13_0097 [Prochlorococcus sp. MIT 0702]|nr:hypothetical protein EV13_0097 [Prochlorococcus sp. MIT 0702]